MPEGISLSPKLRWLLSVMSVRAFLSPPIPQTPGLYIPGEPTSTATLLALLQRVLGAHRERLLILLRRATMNEDMRLEVASRRKVPIRDVTAEEDQPAGAV